VLFFCCVPYITDVYKLFCITAVIDSQCVNVHTQEEFGGRAVSALGVRSRKLSTGLNGQFWD
jgi:hypothetical protein